MGNLLRFNQRSNKVADSSIKTGLTIPELKEQMRLKGLPVIWITGNRCMNTVKFGKAIANHFGYTFIDIDKVLRREVLRSTERGKFLHSMFNLRVNIPSDILISILKEKILRKAKLAKGYVFNGFPNNKIEAELFIRELLNVHYILFVKQDLIINEIDRELFRLKIRSVYGIKSELETLLYEDIDTATIQIRLLSRSFIVNVVTASQPIQQICRNIRGVIKDS